MQFKPMVVSRAIVVACLWLEVSLADDRIWMQAEINGKRARLDFDTGASGLVLWPATAQRFDLKFTIPPTNAPLAPNQFAEGKTEECTLKLWRTTFWRTTDRVQFRVPVMPKYMEGAYDGLIGWGYYGSDLIQIDAGGCKVAFPASLPKKAATWTKLPLRNSACLYLELPQANGTHEILAVDTGDTVGVALRPDKWREWKASHPKQPRTLTSGFMLGTGRVVKEEAWAENLELGPLVLAGVPVTEANPSQVAQGSPQFRASLGIAALKRLDLIVDRRNGVAYLRPKTTPPPAYQHNRLGAVFTHADPKSERMLATVLDDSPAYEAGVRNGDVLLGVDVPRQPNPKTNTYYQHLLQRHREAGRAGTETKPPPFDAIFQGPAGTKLTITLTRGSKTVKATAVLRDIVAPGHAKP
jgi:hypothetical protein